jgi:predicted transcriptional regulator
MFDRIFSGALAFCLLVAGTLAVGSALLDVRPGQVRVVQLPKVQVNGKRAVTVKIVDAPVTSAGTRA